jgi:type I restriction enzyme, S subunit
MNAERLLEHYERVASAPDAIARLRRFILDLAVRGKLVPQHESDEPVSELLERIAKEKARLVKAGEIRTPKAIPALPKAPFPIPSNWRWSQLAEIGILSPRNEAPDALEASFVPMPLIASEYGVANQHEMRPWGEIKKGYTHFAEGDVGLAKITPCFENGKSAVFRNLTGGIGAGTTELHIVRPLFVDQDYVLLFLKSPHFIETGILKMTGTAGQKRVPTGYFAQAPFPLPPLAEQNRIVAKVNELMGLCDRLEAARAGRESVRDRLAAASLARLNAPDPDTFGNDARFALDALPALTARANQIKRLRQTILNLAVRGKLVPQDPNDEPASELLKQIAVEKAQFVKAGKGKRQEPMQEPDPSRAPFALPAGWSWARFPELGNFGRGKSKHRPRNDPSLFDGGTHLMIQTGDVARSKGLIETYTNKYNDFGLSQSFKWPKGTLCITIAANIADSGILNFDACFPDSVVGFIPASMFDNTSYFEYFVRTAKANLLEFAPATAQKNINLEILTQVLIPLPPLAEHQRIVAKVDDLMVLCDRLEASLGTADDTRRSLLAALLAEALAPDGARELEAAE